MAAPVTFQRSGTRWSFLCVWSWQEIRDFSLPFIICELSTLASWLQSNTDESNTHTCTCLGWFEYFWHEVIDCVLFFKLSYFFKYFKPNTKTDADVPAVYCMMNSRLSLLRRWLNLWERVKTRNKSPAFSCSTHYFSTLRCPRRVKGVWKSVGFYSKPLSTNCSFIAEVQRKIKSRLRTLKRGTIATSPEILFQFVFSWFFW